MGPLSIVRVLFWTMSRPKLKQGLRAFKLLLKGTGLGSPQLNGLFTKPSGAQSKNPIIHTYQQKEIYICMEQQEIVKEQCDKEKLEINARYP